MVNALIRYHEGRSAEYKRKLKRQKRAILNQGTVNKKSKDNKNTYEQNVKDVLTQFNLHNIRVYKKPTNYQNQPVKSVKNAEPQKHKLVKGHRERNRGHIKTMK